MSSSGQPSADIKRDAMDPEVLASSRPIIKYARAPKVQDVFENALRMGSSMELYFY